MHDKNKPSNTKIRYKPIICCILLLVLLDQAIKCIINTYFLENHFNIIPGLLEFLPTFNNRHSYIGSLLYKYHNVAMGFFIHLIIILPAECLIISFYSFLRNKFQNTRLLDVAFIFQLSGAICWLIGNFRTNGELDYIYLKPLFVFDLKDVYNNCFVVFWLWFCFINGNQIKSVKVKEFTCYLKNTCLGKFLSKFQVSKNNKSSEL